MPHPLTTIDEMTSILTAAGIPLSFCRYQELAASPTARLRALVAERDKLRLLLDVVMQLPLIRTVVAEAQDQRLSSQLRQLNAWPARDVHAEKERCLVLDMEDVGRPT